MFPLANASAVVLGSRIRRVAAAKVEGLNSMDLCSSAICLRLRPLHPMLKVDTTFCTVNGGITRLLWDAPFRVVKSSVSFI